MSEIKIEDLPAGYFPSVMAKLREEKADNDSAVVETDDKNKTCEVDKESTKPK